MWLENGELWRRQFRVQGPRWPVLYNVYTCAFNHAAHRLGVTRPVAKAAPNIFKVKPRSKRVPT